MRKLLIPFLLMVCAQAHAAFGYYIAVTVDHTKVPSTQSSFPVLVSTTKADLKTVGNGGKVQNANGYDVGLYSDNACTTKLNWETERYIATTGEVLYWVNIASLSGSSDTVFYLCFGNSSITTDQSNKTAVWDSHYKLVSHVPNGTTLTVTDSTSNANNGTNHSGTANTGQIDGAVALSGSSQYVDGSMSLITLPATLSAWVYMGATGDQAVLSHDLSGTTQSGFRIEIYPTNQVNLVFATVAVYDSTFTLATNTWSYVSVSISGNGGTASFRVNGNTSSQSVGTPVLVPNHYSIGAGGAGDLNFNGRLDELRISDSARAADWVTTEYNNQSSPSTFESFGATTPIGGAPPSSFFLLFTDASPIIDHRRQLKRAA